MIAAFTSTFSTLIKILKPIHYISKANCFLLHLKRKQFASEM